MFGRYYSMVWRGLGGQRAVRHPGGMHGRPRYPNTGSDAAQLPESGPTRELVGVSKSVSLRAHGAVRLLLLNYMARGRRPERGLGSHGYVRAASGPLNGDGECSWTRIANFWHIYYVLFFLSFDR